MNAQKYIDELNSLGQRDPGDWPRWAHAMVAIIAALVIVGGGFYYVIQPEQDILAQEQAKEGGLKDELDQKLMKVSALPAYREQLAKMEKDFADRLEELPGRAEIANLLNEISEARARTSLEEELFRPMGEAIKDFYAEIPNQIVVTGGYHQLASFASAVAELTRIVTVEEVDIRPLGAVAKGSSAAADGTTMLRMQAVVKTYRYLDDEETASKKGAKK